MEIEAWRGEMQKKKKKTLQKTLLKLSAHFLCKVFLQERVENEVERRGRNDTRGGNVSHLTCNKAEQITCPLPLTVRLPPQGVSISFNTIPSFKPPAAQVSTFPWRGHI